MSTKHFGIFSHGENDVLDRVLKNLDLSIETSRHLLPMVDFLKSHDYDAALKEAENISNLETQADALHMSTVEDVCVGSFFGGIREDILGLLEEIDNIADAAKVSARIFRQRRISDKSLDYFFAEDVSGFIKTCIEAAGLLKEAILGLEKNKSEVIAFATKVERKEEEADAIKATILENLLKNSVEADVLDVIMLKDFLEIADDVADNSEDGSDVLLELVSKGYT